jgi:hypothetical protein
MRLSTCHQANRIGALQKAVNSIVLICFRHFVDVPLFSCPFHVITSRSETTRSLAPQHRRRIRRLDRDPCPVHNGGRFSQGCQRGIRFTHPSRRYERLSAIHVVYSTPDPPCVASMPSEIILNITSNLHFPDSRALLNSCQVLHGNREAWKAAYRNLEYEIASEFQAKVSVLRRDKPRFSSLSDWLLDNSNLAAMGYSLQDVRTFLGDRVLCFGCLRLRTAHEFATNGRFKAMNELAAFTDWHGNLRTGPVNSGTRRCMDCLGEEGLPNSAEPWLIHQDEDDDGSMDRGFCSQCQRVFVAPYLDVDRRRRRAVMCEKCWDEDTEQIAWAATKSRLKELVTPLKAYLDWMEQQDEAYNANGNPYRDYRGRKDVPEPRRFERQLLSHGLESLPRWTKILNLGPDTEQSEDSDSGAD